MFGHVARVDVRADGKLRWRVMQRIMARSTCFETILQDPEMHDFTFTSVKQTDGNRGLYVVIKPECRTIDMVLNVILEAKKYCTPLVGQPSPSSPPRVPSRPARVPHSSQTVEPGMAAAMQVFE